MIWGTFKGVEELGGGGLSRPLYNDDLMLTFCELSIHRLNMELDLQSLFGLHVPRIWAHIHVRGTLLVR
jgi:hypothetical protein